MMGRTVIVALTPTTNETLTGTRSELKVDPGEAQPGGFRYKRAFAMRVPKTLSGDRVTLEVIKPGMSAVDDTGASCKVVSYELAHNSVLFFFGSKNA